MLACDRGRIAIRNAAGAVEWEYPCRFTAHDLTRLPNGNILFNSGPASVTEVTPDKRVVWSYDAKPKAGYTGGVEVHACQRLPSGLTMIAESGNARIVEVDREGRTVHEVPLTVEKPHPHRDTRLVRKLDNGNYLVAHEGDGMVREYDRAGNVVWKYVVDLAGRRRAPGHDGHGTEVYAAYRLRNGNTMISCGNGNRVIEVNPDGRTVWSVEQNDLPGIRLAWVTMLQMLPNGNVIINNCHAGPDNPQLVEVNRDRQVVWTLKDWTVFGNDVAAAQALDAPRGVIR